MALTQVDQGLLGTYAQYTGFKNRIINGAMQIDQRNNGASVTITNIAAGTYTLDRFGAYGTVASKFSVQQNAGSVTPPTGFTNYLGVTSLSAYSVGAGDLFEIYQVIEGYNTADLGFGSSFAKTITLSFQVYSSLTGTFGGSLVNGAGNRSYPFSYSIPVANTWTTISVSIAGDTTGTWLKTNGSGIIVAWSLGAGSNFSGTANTWATAGYYQPTGSTSVVGTNGATFYITGVQLEKGSNATSFDYRPYGTELSLCQRYYQLISAMNGTTGGSGGTLVYCSIPIPIEMRTTPSLGQTGVIGFETPFGNASTQSSASVTIISAASNTRGVYAYFGNFSGLTANYPLNKYTNSNSLTLSAEL